MFFDLRVQSTAPGPAMVKQLIECKVDIQNVLKNFENYL